VVVLLQQLLDDRAAQARGERLAELALEARRMAEKQALVAYHFYAFALEASARVDAGEVHSATLLATTALGAVEALQGSEYGLDVRTLCADALKRAGSPQAAATRQRAVDYATGVMETIRNMRLRKLYSQRPMVAALFDTTPSPLVVARVDLGRGSPLRQTLQSALLPSELTAMLGARSTPPSEKK